MCRVFSSSPHWPKPSEPRKLHQRQPAASPSEVRSPADYDRASVQKAHAALLRCRRSRCLTLLHLQVGGSGLILSASRHSLPAKWSTHLDAVHKGDALHVRVEAADVIGVEKSNYLGGRVYPTADADDTDSSDTFVVTWSDMWYSLPVVRAPSLANLRRIWNFPLLCWFRRAAQGARRSGREPLWPVRRASPPSTG